MPPYIKKGVTRYRPPKSYVMSFAFAYKGRSFRVRFYGLEKAVETSRGSLGRGQSVMERWKISNSAWVFVPRAGGTETSLRY